MAQSSGSVQRSDSPASLTEHILEDQQPTSVEIVKHTLSEKQGIPDRERRLSFPLPKAQTRWESFPDEIRSTLDAWQAIVYVDDKPLGRLVQPTFSFATPQSSIQSYEFTFRAFEAAKRLVKEKSALPLRIPLDEQFVASVYTIQLFGRCGAESFALPFRYRISGRETATKVSLEQQKEQYIQRHKSIQGGRSSSPSTPQQDYHISCGSEFESCTVVVCLKESPPVLTAFVLSFVVLSPDTQIHKETEETAAIQPKQNTNAPTTSINTTKSTTTATVAATVSQSSTMETLLSSSTTEPKTRDFNVYKDNPIGKVNANNQGKKLKKKKTQKVIKNACGSGHDRSSHGSSTPQGYGYASMASRNRRQYLGERDTSVATNQMVDDILQSMDGGKVMNHGDLDESEKQSIGSPLVHDDVETSIEGTSPDGADHVSPLKAQTENGVRASPEMKCFMMDDSKKREQLPALFDFEEDEVYVRRNRSVGSLVRSPSSHGVLPVSSVAEATVVQSISTTSPLPTTQTPDHQKPQNRPSEKTPFGRSGNGAVSSSPASSPHRINFQYANELLQANRESRGIAEEYGSAAVGRPASAFYADAVMEPHPGNDIEHGVQRQTLHTLFQMGASHQQPMTNLSHQIPTHLSQQIPIGFNAMGQQLIAMQNVMNPTQMLQAQHAVLGNISGIQLSAVFTQEQQQPQQQHAQMRGVTPEPMKNTRDEYRKPKEDAHEDSSCFYMKPTNDLDRFLTEVTPQLQLDPSLESEKAIDQLTLEDVWKFYYECSMLGKEIPLRGSASAKENYCGPSTAYYLPYLSAIQVFTPEDINSTYMSDSNVFICDVEGWPTFMRMQHEQFEMNPPWFRLPLYDTMDELSNRFPELKELKLKDLHPSSWFCVAWYPLYRIPDGPVTTRFLTFHSFQPSVYATASAGRGGTVPLAVYGLEWYNMMEELWMDNIKVAKPLRSPSPSKATENGRCEGSAGGLEMHMGEQEQWLLRIRSLRTTAKTFARGLGFRRSTRHGMADANTHHHDFEYFYERN